MCGIFLTEKFKKPDTEQEKEKTAAEIERLWQQRVDKEYRNFFVYDGTGSGQERLDGDV